MALPTGILRRSFHLYERVRKRFDGAGRRQWNAFGPVTTGYYNEYWRRAAAEVDATVEQLADSVLRISRGGRCTYVRHHEVMLDTYFGRRMVDDKPLMHRVFQDKGWRPPRHMTYRLEELDRACDFMRELGCPVVVKPLNLSGGRGITTGIESRSRLVRASAVACMYSGRAMMEEHVPGRSYRLLFLDGRLIDTVRRDPPTVVGDGSSSIRQLVEKENEERLRGPTKALIPLTIDLEMKYELARKGLSVRSIPDRGEVVRVKTVVNENSATGNHPLSEGVHPSFVELGRSFGSRLNLKLFGMDILTTDIGAPLSESGGVINELNIPPGLHYHDLVAQDSVRAPVGRLVLEAILAGPADDRTCPLD